MVKIKDGIEYEYIKAKEESSINLVFIHGIGFNKAFFEPLAERLTEYNCYLINLPGHGGSKGLEFSFERYINAASDFIREVDNAIVIGHSIGGTIALAIALRRIHKVKGAMVIAGGAESTEYSRELLDEINEGVVNIDSFKESVGDNNEELILSAFNHMETDRVVCNDLKISMSINILHSLNEVNIPLTILCGSEDKLYPSKYAEHVHDKIKHSKLVTFEGVGNMLPLVKVDEVVNEIKELINSIS